MKKLFVPIVLIASVWSSFSYSEQTTKLDGFTIWSGQSPLNSSYTLSHTELYAPCTLNDTACKAIFFTESLKLTANYDGSDVPLILCPDNRITFNGYSCAQVGSMRVTFNSTSSAVTEPSQTCKYLEGSTIGGFHSTGNSYCANLGTTGGANPQPLLCMSKDSIETPAGSSNWTHFVSTSTCTLETGPDGGSGEPDPTDPVDPVDPVDPTPDTGGNPTTGNATTTGTQTDASGNVTDVETTTAIDFSPVTDRQNETNALLGGIKQAIQANGQGEPTDVSGIENRLDTLITNTGTSADGETAANNVEYPDIEQAIETGLNEIQDGINSAQNNQTTDQLENIGSRLTSFDSIPQIFQFATSNCQPIPFGARTLDLCEHAGTVSNVLAWLLTIMTIIFLVTSLNSDIKNIRMS